MRVFAVLLAWVAVACGNAARVPYLEPYPESRVIESGAEGIRYETDVAYPAEPVLAFIRSRVPSQFQPRAESFLNPGISTAHVRGWTSYTDATTRPQSVVQQWDGEWEDPDGNILTYTLTYRSPSPKLQVMGSLFRRAEVDAARQSVARERQPEPAAAPANPSYLVLRAAEGGDVLLDLRDFDFAAAEVVQGSGGDHAVMLPATAPGSEKLKAWTTVNQGRELRIFVDGRQVSAPTIASPISDMIVVETASKEEAERIAARVKRGGA